MSQLEVYFTTPHEVDDSGFVTNPARILARAWNTETADLTAPMGANPRRFDFSINIYDDALGRVKDSKPDGVEAYNTFVYVEWRGAPRFWGPIIDPEWDMEQEQVTFRCMSQLKRLEHHFFNTTDEIIRSDNGFGGLYPLDYRGIQVMIQAGENQSTQDYAPLGLRFGPNTGSLRTQKVKYERGQQILRAMQDHCANSFGPEILENTLSLTDEPPFYAEVLTADKRELGEDKTETCIFQGGFGLDNLQNCHYTPGGKIVTHAHALDRDGKHRETRVNTTSARENGVWVEWMDMDFEVSAADADEILGDGVAQTAIDHYGVPPKFATLTLKRDDELGGSTQKYWGEDFGHGDYCKAEVKKGYMNLPEGIYRIMEIGLKQEDQDTGVRQRVAVVPEVTGTYGDIDE